MSSLLEQFESLGSVKNRPSLLDQFESLSVNDSSAQSSAVPDTSPNGRQIVDNPDGSFSTERSITVTHPGINKGAPTNIPSMFGGVEFDESTAIQKIIEAGGIDPETGRSLPGFLSIDEAVNAAKSRSNDLASLRPLGEELSSSPSAIDQLKNVGLSALKGTMSVGELPFSLANTVGNLVSGDFSGTEAGKTLTEITDFFETGKQSAEKLKPESIKTEIEKPIFDPITDEFNFPNASQLLSVGSEVIPQIPAVAIPASRADDALKLAGLGSKASAAISGGAAGTLVSSPQQFESTRLEAVEFLNSQKDESGNTAFTPEEVASLSQQAAMASVKLSAPVSFILNSIGLGPALRTQGNAASRLAKGAITEGPAEGFEEGVQQFTQGKAIQENINPDRDPKKGVKDSIVLGAVAGAGTGGGVSLLSKNSSRARDIGASLQKVIDEGKLPDAQKQASDSFRPNTGNPLPGGSQEIRLSLTKEIPKKKDPENQGPSFPVDQVDRVSDSSQPLPQQKIPKPQTLETLPAETVPDSEIKGAPVKNASFDDDIPIDPVPKSVELNLKKDNPSDFIDSPKGGKDFGAISPEVSEQAFNVSGVRLTSAPIRLQKGSSKFGLKHILKAGEGRDLSIKSAGYKNVRELVSDVSGNFDEIRQGNNNSLLLRKKNGLEKAAYIELKKIEGEETYRVKTAFVAESGQISLGKLLWERGTLNTPTESGKSSPPLRDQGSPSQANRSEVSIPDQSSPTVTGQNNSSTNISPKINKVKAPSANDLKRSKKLRVVSVNLEKAIFEKRNPAVAQQNLTRRRAGQIDSSHAEADRLQKVQSKINGIADALDAGTLPKVLEKIDSKTVVEDILRSKKFHKPFIRGSALNEIIEKSKGLKGAPELRDKLDFFRGRDFVDFTSLEKIAAVEALAKLASKRGLNSKFALDDLKNGKRLLKSGITTEEQFQEVKTALDSLGEESPKDKDFEKKRKTREAENKLIGTKIPGFFPTPKPVIRKMLDEADIRPGMSVLEPSAGKGDIIEAIMEIEGFDLLDIDLVEPNQALRDVLKAKGIQAGLIAHDFMDFKKTPGPDYDRIVMNPPFEKGQDIDHVRVAYDLLKPEGRIVAIMSEGPFFRNDSRAKDFREFLEEVGGTSEKLDAKSFTGKDSFRQTGVAARLVVIDRPGESKKESERAKPPGKNKDPESDRVSKLPKVVGVKGKESVLKTSTKNHSVQYKIVESFNLITSHNPERFTVDSQYPEGVQERQYHTDKVAQKRIIDQAKNFDPSLVLTDDPTPLNGPPIITDRGIVLGGNSRAMTISRVFSSVGIAQYKSALKSRMERFGIDENFLNNFSEPVLVRELKESPVSINELRALGSDLNRGFTVELSSFEKAVSTGKRISDDTITFIGSELAKMGDSSSLRDLIAANPNEVINRLIKDGAISKPDLPSLIDQRRNLLTDAGKSLIERSLLGTVIDDPVVLSNIPASIRNKITSIIPSIARIKAQGGEWDISSDIRKAAEISTDAKLRDLTSEQFLSQKDLFKGKILNGKQETLFKLFMDGKPKEIKNKFRVYASDASRDIEGQSSFIEPVTPKQSFSQVFEDGEVNTPDISRESGLLDVLDNEVGGIGFKSDVFDRLKKAMTGNDTALNVLDMHEKTDLENQELKGFNPQRLIRSLKRAVIDVSGNIKTELIKKGGKAGQRVIMRHDLIAGASTEAERQFDQEWGDIYKGLDREENKLLDFIIESRRTVTIDGYRDDIQHPGNLIGDDHKAFLDAIPDDLKLKLDHRADIYFRAMERQLTQLFKNGLIDKPFFDRLKDIGDYSPRRFLDFIDPEQTYDFDGQKITVSDSGIKKLDGGKQDALEKDSQLLLSQVIGRIQNRIFRNKANKELYDFAVELPGNGIAEVVNPKRFTKTGEVLPSDQKSFPFRKDDIPKRRFNTPVFPPAKGGMEKVSVVIDGQQHQMEMPNKLAKEWVLRDPAIDSQVANFLGWFSGSKILRATATGFNPEFALTNLPRDLAHIWFSAREYNANLPIALGQIASDMKAVAKDAINRTGRWEDFIKEGGGMNFLTHQGKVFGNLNKHLKAVENILGYVGETSEVWTRLALRERAIKNGASPEEATWAARNYLDFSQGGRAIKAVDSVIPYLNASIQATRGIFRGAQQAPKTFTWKVAQVGMVSMGIYAANTLTNPEAWDFISDEEKAGFFIITTPIFETDKEGRKRYLYFRIPKDHGQRLVASVFEGLIAKTMGHEVNSDTIAKSAQEFLPIVPTQFVPPTLDAALGYMTNTDFWRNREIWKGPQVDEKEEFLPWTHPFFVKAGGVTGASPERMRYVVSQFFVNSNPFMDLVGFSTRAMMDELPGNRERDFIDKINFDLPFVRRVGRFTRPFNQRDWDTLKKVRKDSGTERFKESRNFKTALVEMEKSGDKKPVLEFLKKVPSERRENFLRRFRAWNQIKSIQGIGDKAWWSNLATLNPEARATVYWLKWRDKTIEEKRNLEKISRRIPNLSSQRFRKKFKILVAQDKKKTGEK